MGVYFNIWSSILMHLCTQSLSISICWLERNQGYGKELWKIQGSSCYSNELLALSELIAEHEVRQLVVVQLVVVQGSHISASAYLFVHLCIMLRKLLIQCTGIQVKRTSSLQ